MEIPWGWPCSSRCRVLTVWRAQQGPSLFSRPCLHVSARGACQRGATGSLHSAARVESPAQKSPRGGRSAKVTRTVSLSPFMPEPLDLQASQESHDMLQVECGIVIRFSSHVADGRRSWQSPNATQPALHWHGSSHNYRDPWRRTSPS